MKRMEPREVTHLVIHCSDSTWGDLGEIRKWHLARGFETVGYHWVIHNAHPYTSRETDPMFDGLILPGRNEDEQGAHAPGYNYRSLGICLVGKTHFSHAQMLALERQVRSLMVKYGIGPSRVIGHYETEHEQGKPEHLRKTCPNIDMGEFRQRLQGSAR